MDLWNSFIRPAFSDSLEGALKARYEALSDTPVETGRDGGIGFPSLEGALLSLAFLTFAVFLVDLIQTLIARLRGATNVNMMTTTMGRKLRTTNEYNSILNPDINTVYNITSSISANEGLYAQNKPQQWTKIIN